MTREEAKQLLLDGKTLYVDGWMFDKWCIDCSDGCCYDAFNTVEEVLDRVEMYSFSWEDVTLL